MNSAKTSPRNQALDYLPIIAYFGFWLQGAAIPAIITKDPRLMALGIVTLPAIAAMTAALIKIRAARQTKNPDK